MKKEKRNPRTAARRRKLKKGTLEPLRIRPDAAGIDVGATELFVAVPPEKDTTSVRSFPPFTRDLVELADWLDRCGVRTVAMESTGVYWIPIFQILEERGIEVLLVNALAFAERAWPQDGRRRLSMDSTGALDGSVERKLWPAQEVCAMRSIVRQRESLPQAASQQILMMQKSLDQMNLQLHHVLSDITGVSGLAILEAILRGERDGLKLAGLCEKQVKSSTETIVKALEGDYRPEHLFTLRQSLQLYRFLQGQIAECQTRIREELAGWDSKTEPGDSAPPAGKPIRIEGLTTNESETLRQNSYRVLGVDLTRIDGINGNFLQVFLAEVGPDLSRFRSPSAFASWLKLSPNREVSGGKVLKSKTEKNASRMAKAFRMAANALLKSRSALGDCFRRLRTRLGAPQAITAMAHKLSRIVYHLVTTRQTFDPTTLERDQEQQRIYQEIKLRKAADRLGFQLVPKQAA